MGAAAGVSAGTAAGSVGSDASSTALMLRRTSKTSGQLIR